MTMGPILIWIFALKLGILPVARWGTWQQALLPAFTLGIGSAAILARLTRASMLQVLREDYIRTARATGASEARTLGRHALANALTPLISVIGLQAGSLRSGCRPGRLPRSCVEVQELPTDGPLHYHHACSQD